MAGDIEEAGVRFIVENLESYLAQVKLANGATTNIGTSTATAAQVSGINWAKIGAAAIKTGGIIGAVAIGIGLALLKIGGAFDEAYDSIAIKTGETGPVLEGLEESFRNVFTSIPADGGDVALAIGSINQKLDLTGEPLEALSTQLLELSRITGTDLQANIDATAQAFQRWQTPAEAMPGILDELFRASQESGVPVADLATALSDNKAVIDALGLTLPEAVTLIGGLGKAGIDSDTAFQGLKLAMTKMAREGVEDPKAELEAYFKRIKDAKTDADATAIAVEIFGRNAVTMAGAIRDGTLDVDKFALSMDENKNTILGTSEATADWQEKLTLLKNKALVAIEPAATALFKAVSNGVEEVGPLLEKFSAWFTEEIQPAIAEATAVFKTDWLPVIERVGQTLQDFWDQVGEPILRIWGENVKAIGVVFKEVALIVGAVIDGDFSAAFEHLKALVTATFDFIVGYIKGTAEAFLAVGMYVFGKIAEAVDAVAGDAIRAVIGFLGDVVTAITSFAGAMLSAGRALFEAVSDGIMSVPILGDVIGIGVDIASAVAGWASGMFSRGYDVMIAVLDGLKSAWQAILDWVSNLPSLTDLLPDIGGADVITVPVTLDFVVTAADPNWLLTWFNEEQDKERQRALLQEAWQAWLEEHPLELSPKVRPGDPSILIPEETIEDWQEYLDDHPLDVKPSLKPDLPKILDLSIPEDSNWLLEWFQKQQDAERLREQMEEAMNAWLQEHPLEITPAMKIKIPGFFTPLVEPELNKKPKKPGDKIKPGDDTTPGDGGTTDPGQLLALVMQAIATIEAIANSNLAPVSQQKLMGIAQSLRSIVIEFSNAMRGIEPEAVEAAALIADFVNPILEAINNSVDILSNEAISKFGGANMAGFRTLFANMAELALIAGQTIGSLDIADSVTESAQRAVTIVSGLTGMLAQAYTMLTDDRFSKYSGANVQGYRVLLANMAEVALLAAQTIGALDIGDAVTGSVGKAIKVVQDLATALADAFAILSDPRFSSYGGANMQGYRTLFANLAELMQISIDTLSGFDVATVNTAEEILAVLARMINQLQSIIPQPGPGPDPGPLPLPGPDPRPDPGPIPPIDDVLSRISGSLPGVGASLAGLQGGVTYHVSAVYTNPQSPQSIRLDLEAIAMMASA